VDKQKRWEGTLVSFEQGVLTLEAAPGKTIRFPLTQVDKANLKFEW
jgi:ribosome maturation factor RimP